MFCQFLNKPPSETNKTRDQLVLCGLFTQP